MKELALKLERARVEIRDSTLAPPVVTYVVSDKKWRLEERYRHRDGDREIRVPDQFTFDLASIPRAFWWLVAPFELSIAAPLIHDFLYRFRGDPPQGSIVPPRLYSREQADVLFREIMKHEGVWAWRRAAAYRAVRLFGAAAWGR
jgi:hypothetical protein